MWLELAAAFYAGYNTYKFMNNKGSKWYEMMLGEKVNTYNGVYLQMWLSNILTYLYVRIYIKKLLGRFILYESCKE